MNTTAISVNRAWEILNANRYFPGTVSLPLQDCLGKVLAEEILNDRDQPPFDRVMMDGFAIRRDDYENGHREYSIARLLAAGYEPGEALKSGEAVEIMTGAVLPPQGGMVVRYEDCESDGKTLHIKVDNLTSGCNIHPRGSDNLKGTTLINSGEILWAPELAIAATVGKSILQVFRCPEIGVFSTGDELVAIETTPLDWQIRRSNDTAIQALLMSFGYTSKSEYIRDDASLLRSALENGDGCDVSVFCGGVSAGKFDLLPETLRSEGYEVLIHGIAQKPGKPFLFARNHDRFVFGLPGNPVSAMVCAARYLLPWLNVSFGKAAGNISVLVEPVPAIKSGFTHFIDAKLYADAEGTKRAKPDKGNGSGDLMHLHHTDGFVEINDSCSGNKALCSFWKIKP
jgi:molybdopterin molybdotransferase